jgi:hypothetical protein
VPTGEGFLYLAVVLDVFSRRIVGWSMSCHLYTELMLRALDMALAQRRPDGVIHHSDQGCQYTSIAFGRRCREAGVRLSMGTVADCFDNAMCESFFATLECELLARSHFATHEQARREIFHFLEAWYNPLRLHSGLGYRSPIIYEQLHAAQKPISSTCELPTAGRRRGRDRRPADRPWTTRSTSSNGGNLYDYVVEFLVDTTAPAGGGQLACGRGRFLCRMQLFVNDRRAIAEPGSHCAPVHAWRSASAPAARIQGWRRSFRTWRCRSTVPIDRRAPTSRQRRPKAIEVRHSCPQ